MSVLYRVFENPWIYRYYIMLGGFFLIAFIMVFCVWLSICILGQHRKYALINFFVAVTPPVILSLLLPKAYWIGPVHFTIETLVELILPLFFVFMLIEICRNLVIRKPNSDQNLEM